jgi:hypothetical protein
MMDVRNQLPFGRLKEVFTSRWRRPSPSTGISMTKGDSIWAVQIAQGALSLG